MPFIQIPQSCIELINDNFEFSGYLVFEIIKSNENTVQESDNYYICNIFWINDLNDLKQRNKYYFYNIGWRFYEDEIFLQNKNDTNSNCLKFISYYKNFYKKYSDSSYHFFLEERLSSQIFFNPNVCFFSFEGNNDNGYFIFHNSFNGMLIQYNAVLSGLKKQSKALKNTYLLPTSQKYELYSITEEEAHMYSIYKAGWFPELLIK